MTTDRTTPLARKAAQHHAAGELSAAAEAYRQLLAEASTAHSYAGLGSVLIDQRAFAEGLAIFESGLSHFPEDRLLAEGRAVCLDRQMQIGAAVAAYQAVLTRHPESDLAWNNLGTLLNRQGRNADALAAFDRARALVPEHKGFQSNVLLALNYSDAFSAQTIAARHAVIANTTRQRIRITAAIQDVTAGTTNQAVTAKPAIQGVAARSTIQRIVRTATYQHIRERIAGNRERKISITRHILNMNAR